MSDHIYSQLFSESTSSLRICQYVHCGATLTRPDQKKFCNLSCCNRQNALRLKCQAEVRREVKIQEYNLSPKLCQECNSKIPYERTLNGPIKYCNHSCAAKYNNKVRPSESRIKQSITIKSRIDKGEVNIKRRPDNPSAKQKSAEDASRKYPFSKITWKICDVTGKPYHTRLVSRGHRQNSPYAKSIKAIYYQLAKFKFNVYHMPDLFDLDLLAKLGWYTCPGKKRQNYTKNTNGVSRDHLYSISQGIDNKVHPLLLGHPVNCKLIEHKKNKLKHSACELTIDELITNIKQFDNKTHRYKDHDRIITLINDNQIYVNDWESLRNLI